METSSATPPCDYRGDFLRVIGCCWGKQPMYRCNEPDAESGLCVVKPFQKSSTDPSGVELCTACAFRTVAGERVPQPEKPEPPAAVPPKEKIPAPPKSRKRFTTIAAWYGEERMVKK